MDNGKLFRDYNLMNLVKKAIKVTIEELEEEREMAYSILKITTK